MKRIIFSLAILAMGMKLQAQTPISCYPLNQAKDINIDTHLIIEFDSEVKAGFSLPFIIDLLVKFSPYFDCTSLSLSFL